MQARGSRLGPSREAGAEAANTADEGVQAAGAHACQEGLRPGAGFTREDDSHAGSEEGSAVLARDGDEEDQDRQPRHERQRDTGAEEENKDVG